MVCRNKRKFEREVLQYSMVLSKLPLFFLDLLTQKRENYKKNLRRLFVDVEVKGGLNYKWVKIKNRPIKTLFSGLKSTRLGLLQFESNPLKICL